MHKDETGWTGPASVVHIDDSGTVSVKFNGHIYMCATRHVRHALTFFDMLSTPGASRIQTSELDLVVLSRFQTPVVFDTGFVGEAFWPWAQGQVQSFATGRVHV